MNVTRAILPYFRERRGGMIITTSSMGGLITFPLYSVYHGTKWAIEGFMESLQYELRAFNIKVKNIEPGAIKTDFENAIEFVTTDAYKNYRSQSASQHVGCLQNSTERRSSCKKGVSGSDGRILPFAVPRWKSIANPAVFKKAVAE